jgi:hypothetical protein
MKDILQDIMIINFDGKTLACKIINFLDIKEFVGMLIRALSSFAQEIHEVGLYSFEFANLRFDLFKRNQIIFVGTTDKKVKQRTALKELKKVADDFFNQYPAELLSKLNGDLSIFSKFEKKLAISKKDQLLEFISSHWPYN